MQTLTEAATYPAGEQMRELRRLSILLAEGAEPAAVLLLAAEVAARAAGSSHGAVVLSGGSEVFSFEDPTQAERGDASEAAPLYAAAQPASAGAALLERGLAFRQTVPVRLGGRELGTLIVSASREPALPPDTGFLEIVASLIAPTAADVLAAGGDGDSGTWVSYPDIGALLESMSDAVALISTDGRLRMANAAYRRLMADAGVEEGPLAASAELIQLRDRNGRPVKPDDRALIRALAGQTTRAERILRMADGRDRVFALNGSPVLSPGAEVTGVAIVLRDITEQIARERALRLMEELRRGLSLSGDLSHAARAVCRRAVSLLAWVDMAAVFGLDGDDLTLLAQAGFPSRAARLLAGIALSPLHRAGQAVRDSRPTIFHADRDEPGSEAARRFVVASGSATFVNLPLVAGTSAFGLIVLASREQRVPSRDELALLEALAAQIGAELEGVRRREQAETERSRLQAVLNQLPEGVLLLDEAGRLVMSNRSAEEIVGQPVDATIPVVALTSRLG
ncbi:MAG: GAF domain-containing protein, partial [Dehalococcoidia bacterium]